MEASLKDQPMGYSLHMKELKTNSRGNLPLFFVSFVFKKHHTGNVVCILSIFETEPFSREDV